MPGLGQVHRAVADGNEVFGNAVIVGKLSLGISALADLELAVDILWIGGPGDATFSTSIECPEETHTASTIVPMGSG
jgi:hypothetical protein